VIVSLPRFIFFDLDGTLLDSLPGIEYSLHAAFAECGLPLRHDNLREMIGPPIRSILSSAGEIKDLAMLDALERAFRESYDSEGWRKTVCFPDISMVLELLCKQQHRLFVVSNKPRHISLQILKTESILDCFEEILTRDSKLPVYRNKEEMIEAILLRHLINPRNCLMVGDTIEDAKAAEATGISFVYMTYGYGKVGDETSIPITCRFDSFSQFLPLMEKEFVRD
jgi:phosphoglycolate phosphatase